MLASLNLTHAALALLLLSNPALGWVTWYGSTQRYDPYDPSTFATAATTQQPDARREPAAAPPQGHRSFWYAFEVWELRDNTVLDSTVHGDKGGDGEPPIDLIKLLNLSSGTPGVAQVPGPILNVPAFKLRPGFGQVQVPNPGAVAAALSSPAGFTLVFVYRQHRKSLGTLLSVHPPGRVTPWFQLASNLRTGQLVLHYRLTTDAKLHQNAWSLRPPAQLLHSLRTNAVGYEALRKGSGLGWTYMSLSLNTTTNMLRMQLDCQPPREQPLAGTGGSRPGPSPRLNVPEDALVYFRQEPGFKKKFLGSMQVAKVLPFASSEHGDWACDGYQLARPPH